MNIIYTIVDGEKTFAQLLWLNKDSAQKMQNELENIKTISFCTC